MKPLAMKQLNRVLVNLDPERMRGILDAANWLNEQTDLSRNGYAVGDVMLCKFNLISKRRLRKRMTDSDGGAG